MALAYRWNAFLLQLTNALLRYVAKCRTICARCEEFDTRWVAAIRRNDSYLMAFAFALFMAVQTVFVVAMILPVVPPLVFLMLIVGKRKYFGPSL